MKTVKIVLSAILLVGGIFATGDDSSKAAKRVAAIVNQLQPEAAARCSMHNTVENKVACQEAISSTTYREGQQRMRVLVEALEKRNQKIRDYNDYIERQQERILQIERQNAESWEQAIHRRDVLDRYPRLLGYPINSLEDALVLLQRDEGITSTPESISCLASIIKVYREVELRRLEAIQEDAARCERRSDDTWFRMEAQAFIKRCQEGCQGLELDIKRINSILASEFNKLLHSELKAS